MRRRKAAKVAGGGAVPMTVGEKPVDHNTHGYTGGAPNNGYPGPGTGAAAHDYNGQPPPVYGGQNNYSTHQNEYNSSYNGGQQQSFAPPSGPPPMNMPSAHY